MLTQKRLKKILNYNPETGVFIWNVNKGQRARKGNIAGCANQYGYIEIGIDKISYLAHRLAWLYVYGYFPEYDVDHIDRTKYHNWLANLREASRQCNTRNCGNSKANKSGVKGVCWNKKHGKYHANISTGKGQKHLGFYNDFQEAVCARLAGEQCIDWSGCDSHSPAYQYVKDL